MGLAKHGLKDSAVAIPARPIENIGVPSLAVPQTGIAKQELFKLRAGAHVPHSAESVRA